MPRWTSVPCCHLCSSPDFRAPLYNPSDFGTDDFPLREPLFSDRVAAWRGKWPPVFSPGFLQDPTGDLELVINSSNSFLSSCTVTFVLCYAQNHWWKDEPACVWRWGGGWFGTWSMHISSAPLNGIAVSSPGCCGLDGWGWLLPSILNDVFGWFNGLCFPPRRKIHAVGSQRKRFPPLQEESKWRKTGFVDVSCCSNCFSDIISTAEWRQRDLIWPMWFV